MQQQQVEMFKTRTSNSESYLAFSTTGDCCLPSLVLLSSTCPLDPLFFLLLDGERERWILSSRRRASRKNCWRRRRRRRGPSRLFPQETHPGLSDPAAVQSLCVPTGGGGPRDAPGPGPRPGRSRQEQHAAGFDRRRGGQAGTLPTHPGLQLHEPQRPGLPAGLPGE